MFGKHLPTEPSNLPCLCVRSSPPGLPPFSTHEAGGVKFWPPIISRLLPRGSAYQTLNLPLRHPSWPPPAMLTLSCSDSALLLSKVDHTHPRLTLHISHSLVVYAAATYLADS